MNMINCAHPTHFTNVLGTGEPWTERIQAVRANASSKSHAELDEVEEFDDGDPRWNSDFFTTNSGAN
jgi:S-methylmethionine-dependent homocysteine/selenocysteine methylase